jgi:hypothetical protein
MIADHPTPAAEMQVGKKRKPARSDSALTLSGSILAGGYAGRSHQSSIVEKHHPSLGVHWLLDRFAAALSDVESSDVDGVAYAVHIGGLLSVC